MEALRRYSLPTNDTSVRKRPREQSSAAAGHGAPGHAKGNIALPDSNGEPTRRSSNRNPGPMASDMDDFDRRSTLVAEDSRAACKTPCALSYSKADLLNHLRRISGADEDLVTALGEHFRQRYELTPGTIFRSSLDPLSTNDGCSQYEVYDVDGTGEAVPRHDRVTDGDDEEFDPESMWDAVKVLATRPGATPMHSPDADGQQEVNLDSNAIGRVTIVTRPCTAMLAGIHLALGRHFDTDEVLAQLVSRGPRKRRTAALCLDRAFDPRPLRQRSFLFVFRYYTVVGEGLTPTGWQQHDDRRETTTTAAAAADHVNITECTGILGLSLGGEPVAPRTPARRNRKTGVVYDTFAPFHVLSIRCYADHVRAEHELPLEERCWSGPYVFLACLAAEYRAAVRRYAALNEQIADLIAPPNRFMFDAELRDKLLFEDADFTFSRRYFWAYNSLGMISDSAKALAAAYTETFTPAFWAGAHPTLWPYDDDDNNNNTTGYGDALAALRRELEAAVGQLGAVAARNERVRADIDSLRDQLYSGSSVRENRLAIEQGENVKVLTGVSMLFLPLTFVTSIFGMTEMPISPDDWRFVVTLIAVCVPFFVLTFVLQTDAGLSRVKRLRAWVARKVVHGGDGGGGGGWTRARGRDRGRRDDSSRRGAVDNRMGRNSLKKGVARRRGGVRGGSSPWPGPAAAAAGSRRSSRWWKTWRGGSRRAGGASVFDKDSNV